MEAEVGVVALVVREVSQLAQDIFRTSQAYFESVVTDLVFISFISLFCKLLKS